MQPHRGAGDAGPLLRPHHDRPHRDEPRLGARRQPALTLFVALLAFPSLARAEPVLTPPRALTEPRLELPEDTPPPPPDAVIDLLLDIDASGAVVRAEVAAPLRADIDALAIEAARALHFEPARSDGVPIPSRVRLRLVVSSPAEPEPPPEAPPAAATSAPVRAPDDSEPAYETVVRGAIIAPEPGASSRVVLRGAELTTVPGTFGDPLRVVATLPGVARSPFGLGYFLVRGASFENTGFLVDGFPVPILYHLFSGPAVLSAQLVDRLDFYPGGYPVAFGRFSAGIISVHTAPPPVRRLHLEAEVDLFRAGALAVVPIGKGATVAVAARRSYYDLLLPLIVDGVDVSYADYQIRADWRILPRLRASAFLFASQDALDVSQAAGTGTTTSTQQTGFSYAFVRGIGTLAWELSRDATLTWSGMLGRDWTSAKNKNPGRPDLGVSIVGTYVGERVTLALPVDRTLRTSIGLDLVGTRYDTSSAFPAPLGLGEFPRPDFDPRTVSLESRAQILAAAFFVEPTLAMGPFELVPGLRADFLDYGDVSRVEPDPRGVLRFHATDAVTLQAASGLFTQPPVPIELDRDLGAPGLLPVRSWQSSTGAQVALPEAIEVAPTLFYTRMWQLTRVSGAFTIEDGVARRETFVADGEGRAYGLELLVRRKVERGLYGWVSYTLARSERFLPGGEVQPFAFDQTHTLNVAASYRTGKWRFGARFTLASGRPTPRVTGAVFDADANQYRPERSGLDYRLPTYHQLDIRIDRDFRLGPIACSAFLDVINVYYAENAEGRIYEYDFSRWVPLPGIPILPTLGISGEYE